MISNDPYSVRRITNKFVWWKNLFNPNELYELEKYCDNLDLSPAKVISLDESKEFDESIRKSKISFFNKNDKTSWIFNKFNNLIENVNNEFYQFDLYGYDCIQYTVYDSSDDGKYDWHMDAAIDNELCKDMQSRSTRKLSIVMMLSDPEKDFTGGQFNLNFGQENNPDIVNFEKGMILCFPSFIIHRVTPVISGIRKTLVIWVEGPKFR